MSEELLRIYLKKKTYEEYVDHIYAMNRSEQVSIERSDFKYTPHEESLGEYFIFYKTKGSNQLTKKDTDAEAMRKLFSKQNDEALDILEQEDVTTYDLSEPEVLFEEVIKQ